MTVRIDDLLPLPKVLVRLVLDYEMGPDEAQHINYFDVVEQVDYFNRAFYHPRDSQAHHINWFGDRFTGRGLNRTNYYQRQRDVMKAMSAHGR